MSATVEKSQRIMFMVLPIAFIPFIIQFKAGLVLYWVTTNLWTVGQGLITRQLMPKKGAPPPKRSSRTPPRGAQARDLVERIAAAIGVDCRVQVDEDDDAVHVQCSGRDLGVLIGRHGQTIDAIQYLANAIAYRAFPDDRKEVVVDAAGYRERRRSILESLAVRSAERAVRAGEPVELEPMTAVERKVVHLRLKEYPGVETSSEGSEPNRYVVVSPVDA